MSKSRRNRDKRDWIAVDAHFRNSAGEFKDKKLDKRLDRKRARYVEKNYECDDYDDQM